MTRSALAIRRARATDAAAITLLVRASFAADVRDLMIYGAPGAAAWVRAQLAVPARIAERAYVVAQNGGSTVGTADVVRSGDTLFLAYIAVAEHARGGGLAASLLRAAVSTAATPRHTTFALDVFADNLAPRHWYGRLGLDEVGESAWWVLDLAAPEPGIPNADIAQVIVGGNPAAAATQRAFGFSQLQIATATATYTVGRIGRQWFRLVDPAAADDPALLRTLGALDPGRRVLVIGPRDARPAAAAAAPLATTVRMRAPLAVVRERLGIGVDHAADGPERVILNA